MEYRQQIIEDVINKTEHGIYHNTKMVSGRRVESSDRILIETFDGIHNEELDVFLKFIEQIKVDNLIRYIEEKMSNIKCSIFTTVHREIISVNSIRENREYGYIKIVCRNCYCGLLFREIPIFFSDCQIDVVERINAAINYIKNIIQKKTINIGKQEYLNQKVIFSQQASGYFIHEVIGHMLEEDIYEYSSVLFNKRMPSILTVKDNVYGHESLIGIGQYDDLGMRIKPITLIEKGEIKSLLSLKNNTYGTARRSSYKNDVLPRMRCTYIEKNSKKTKKDYIRENAEIICVENIYSGVASFIDGQYSIAGDGIIYKDNAKYGYIANLVISGSIIQCLDSIIDIGDDLKIFTAECNKIGNIIRVGVGGPSILITNLDVVGDTYVYE